MRIFGSLNSRIMESAVQPAPFKGQGATVTSYTDRYAGTVIEISAGTQRPVVWVREDKAERMDSNGMSDSQSYYYSPDPEGRVYVFRQDTKGQWHESYMAPSTGRWRAKQGGLGLVLGVRDKHFDYGF